MIGAYVYKREEKTAGSDDTSSMIKGGGYIGACNVHMSAFFGSEVCDMPAVCI